MKRSPDFTNIMTECPLERHADFSWPKDESVESFAFCRARLSDRGRRVLDRLLILLPSHLRFQHPSSFPPVLLFSICDALRLDHADGSAEPDDQSVLPSVLSKLRDWRLVDPGYRYSPRGIQKLAFDLTGIIDEASAPASFRRTSHARLRMKWVCPDSPRESQDRESCSSTPSRSHVLDPAQACVPALGLDERRSDSGYESCQDGRLGTLDSEGTGAAASPRYHSISGFRSGCSACRHLWLSGPTPTPSAPFNGARDVNINSPRHHTSSVSLKKTRREKHKSSQSVSRGTHPDENEPPLAKSTVVQQRIGVSSPHQRTHISNTHSSREPSSPVTTSAHRYLEPSHFLNQACKRDKHTIRHRLASVDLRLSMASSCSNPASLNDLHPRSPTQSVSYTPTASHGVGSVGGCLKLSSNGAESRSSKRLPSWSRTHPNTTTTTTSVKPGSLSLPPAKARFANPLPLPGASSISIPRSVLNDVKHRDRCVVSSQTHKHTSSIGVLPLPPVSPRMHARTRRA